jgi:putative transposase
MARHPKYSPERRTELIRQIEEGVARGKTMAESCMDARVTTTMYSRWRMERSLAGDAQAQRLWELEHENAKLRRIVCELSLQKLTLKDFIASGGL